LELARYNPGCVTIHVTGVRQQASKDQATGEQPKVVPISWDAA
jgi:hypothetical protein